MSESARDDAQRLWRILGRDTGPESYLIATLAALLYLRWLDFQETEEEAVSAFEGRVHVPILPKHLRWTNWKGLPAGELHEEFDRQQEVSRMDAERNGLSRQLAAVWRFAASPTYFNAADFQTLLDWVGDLPLEVPRDREHASAILEELAYTRELSTGEFLTPRPVIDLMIDLVEPKPGDRVYDPCFGTGGLLVAAVNKMKDGVTRLPPRAWTELQTSAIFGVEIDEKAFIVALARIVLAGITNPRLEIGDALQRSTSQESAGNKFDCILANPPWSMQYPKEKATHFPIQTTNSESLFLQHIMASLRPGGRAVMAVPEGFLFRGGTERFVRQRLLQEFRVEGVISLPQGAFLPYTSVKTSLIVFRREKPISSVRFMTVSSLKDTAGMSSAAILNEEPLESSRIIASRFREGQDAINLWHTSIGQLGAREFELVVKRTGDEELSALLQKLPDLDTSVQVAGLEDIAEVIRGVSYDRHSTQDRADGPRSTGLLRVADLIDSGIKRPTLFVSKLPAERSRQQLSLQPGDILLSISGTIGKLVLISFDSLIAVARDASGTCSIVPTQSIALIRPGQQVNPTYLLSVLRSRVVQDWLAGHARGAAVQHLSIRTLRNLQIPVPPLAMQQTVADRARSGKDALFELGTILRKDSQDPIRQWLLTLDWIDATRGSADIHCSTIDETRWKDLLRESPRLRNWSAHHVDDRNPRQRLGTWVTLLTELLTSYSDAEKTPDGLGRLTTLQPSLAKLESALKLLENADDLAEARAFRMTGMLKQLWEDKLHQLFEDVDIQACVNPDHLYPSKNNTVTLTLVNKGVLPLRDFVVTTEPDIGASMSSSYFRQSGELSTDITLSAQLGAHTYDFTVFWTARRMDDKLVDGSRVVSLAVQSIRDEVHEKPLGSNPYITGVPVDRPEMFFGRKDIISSIHNYLEKSANVVLLEGNRRTGKSSILKRLQDDGIPGWIVVKYSFQEGGGDETRAGVPTKEVFRSVAKRIGEDVYKAGTKTWPPGIPDPEPNQGFLFQFVTGIRKAFDNDYPFETLQLYVDSVISAIAPRRLLLMLDEFDKLQEGIDNRITSPQVPENIRQLIFSSSRLTAILTGSRRLKRLREEYWSMLFGLGNRIPVGVLNEEEARDLVVKPVEGRLTYTDDARDYVAWLCAGHPYYLQTLCSMIFMRASALNSRLVSKPEVDAAADLLVVDNEHFRTLWDYVSTERRRLILAVCDRYGDEAQPITYQFLRDQLSILGVSLDTNDDFGDDITFLRELELVELVNEQYRITVPLMRKWIRKEFDFTDIVQKAVRESQRKAK